MSWDRIEWEDVAKCACGKGHIIKHCCEYESDWLQRQDGGTHYDIECPNCKTKYHIQTYTEPSSYREPHFRETQYASPVIKERYLTLHRDSCFIKVFNWYDFIACNDFHEYLTPIGMNISPIRRQYFFNLTLLEEIVALFTVNELNEIITDMKQNKYSTRVHGNSCIIVEMFRKQANTKALPKIIPVLQTIVQQYESYEWNPKTVAEFRQQEDIKIRENEQEIEKIIAQSYELHFEKGEKRYVE